MRWVCSVLTIGPGRLSGGGSKRRIPQNRDHGGPRREEDFTRAHRSSYLSRRSRDFVLADQSAAHVGTEVVQNQNANSVDREALDRVPVFDQDYVTTLSRFLDDSAIGTNGVTLVVNGVEANGPGVSASAVKEVRINQNPYSALFSRPGRARLEITTKEGTPQFHGSLNLMFRDSVST